MSGFPPVRLLPVVASRFALDGGAMFGVIPRPLWERRFAPDDRGRIDLVVRVLVAEFPESGRTVVIDSGVGSAWPRREIQRYKLDTDFEDLGQLLLARGIDPLAVTDAVITHLHFDHAGGWVRRGEKGVLEPIFPRATHHVQRSQLDWARAPSSRDRGSFSMPLIEPLEYGGLLRSVDGNEELFPGLELLAVDGHSPGLQIPVLRGRSKTVAFPADLIPTAAHARANWIMAYDLQPLVTLEDKQRVLDLAVDERWTLVFEHDPTVEAAAVERISGEFVLNPCVCPGEL